MTPQSVGHKMVINYKCPKFTAHSKVGLKSSVNKLVHWLANLGVRTLKGRKLIIQVENKNGAKSCPT